MDSCWSEWSYFTVNRCIKIGLLHVEWIHRCSRGNCRMWKMMISHRYLNEIAGLHNHCSKIIVTFFQSKSFEGEPNILPKIDFAMVTYDLIPIRKLPSPGWIHWWMKIIRCHIKGRGSIDLRIDQMKWSIQTYSFLERLIPHHKHLTIIIKSLAIGIDCNHLISWNHHFYFFKWKHLDCKLIIIFNFKSSLVKWIQGVTLNALQSIPIRSSSFATHKIAFIRNSLRSKDGLSKAMTGGVENNDKGCQRQWQPRSFSCLGQIFDFQFFPISPLAKRQVYFFMLLIWLVVWSGIVNAFVTFLLPPLKFRGAQTIPYMGSKEITLLKGKNIFKLKFGGPACYVRTKAFLKNFNSPS